MTETDKRIPPIKICFIMPKAYALFNPECASNFGGAEVDLYYLAIALAQDPEFDVSFIVADYGQPPIEQRENVTLIRSINLRQNALLGARRLRRAVAQADADIYMLETPSPGLPLVARFCRRHRRHLVYRTASTLETDGSYVTRHPFLGRAFAWSLRQARVVFTQNRADVTRMQTHLGITPVVAPNAHRIPPLADTPRDTVLWVGRSAPVKRPELFLRLARQLPQQHFTMICQQATGDHKYQQLTAQAHAVGNLDFVPHVSFHQIASYFQRARVFVNTSDSEGFPNTFIQACLAATPIVSLSVNPDNFLNLHGCGRCAEGDWPTLVNALGELLDEPNAAPYRHRARRYAEIHHDIAVIAQQYKKVFLQIISG